MMVKYTPFTLKNFRQMPHIEKLTEEQIKDIEIVGSVFPFKVNNYVLDELINWDNIPEDPMFITTFPQKEMLIPEDYARMKSLHDAGADRQTIAAAANEIRLRLNPNPAGQADLNVPSINEQKFSGIQHKYRETVLFFPAQGQSCHAFCTFCFRWPQFSGIDELTFSSSDVSQLTEYLASHPLVTDVLFTGGDPLVMKTHILARYIEPLLAPEFSHIRNIRIGSRTLTYWPYRFVTDDDADDLLNLFRKIRQAGKHLAFMAHFNHPVELSTNVVKEAIGRIQDTGAVIRTQSPVLRHINDSAEVWAELWRRQVALNCMPYYMFIARDTGAQHYFSVSLTEAWNIFRKAYQSVSGICRTARGPSMSCLPGKVQVLGVAEIRGEKVFVLRMIQGRNPEWVDRPFFAAYDEKAIWYSELKPAFGEEKFFFQDEMEDIMTAGEQEIFYE